MTEQGVLDPIRMAAAVAVDPEGPPVVSADFTLRQAAEEAVRLGQRSFIIASGDDRFAIDVQDLVFWAFGAAKGEGKTRVENQIALLKRLYRAEQPALAALKTEGFVPRVIVDASLSTFQTLPDDVRDVADTIERFAMGFNRIYVCESGLHTWPGYSPPPTDRCVNGKLYKLQPLDE